MKACKKLAAILLTVAMVMSLNITVSAVNSVNITVNNPIQGSTYSGYRLLDATTSLKVENCHAVDGGHSRDCYYIAYTVNDKYLDILKEVTRATTRREIIDYIQDLTESVLQRSITLYNSFFTPYLLIYALAFCNLYAFIYSPKLF